MNLYTNRFKKRIIGLLFLIGQGSGANDADESGQYSPTTKYRT